MNKRKEVNFSELQGKIINYINYKDDDKIEIKCTDGSNYEMYHEPECCEGVYIDDIEGNLQDLLNNPILLAEKVTSTESYNKKKEELDESFTWTFYKLNTINAQITIRWFGSSNGYYSEEVTLFKLIEE